MHLWYYKSYTLIRRLSTCFRKGDYFMKKAIKAIAAVTALAAGIGAVVYFIKNKLHQEDLSDDFDDDFDEDSDDFDDDEDEAAPESSREYVNLNKTEASANTEDEPEEETEDEADEASEETPADEASVPEE